MRKRKLSSSATLAGQEKITKYVLRSRIPPKAKDDDVKIQHKGTAVRKRSSSPTTGPSRSPENPSSIKKTPVSVWNRVQVPENVVKAGSDPYDFDNFCTEYNVKENKRPKNKNPKTRPKKIPKVVTKPKTVRATRKKKAPLNASNSSGISPKVPVLAPEGSECPTKLTTVDADSVELPDMTEIEVARRDRHFEKSTNMVESPESILGGLLEVCLDQNMATKRYELSISLYQEPDAIFPSAGTPFSTKEKPTNPERCTSTPQMVDGVAETPSSLSPICKASRPRLQELDLNSSGFLAEKNARTYRRNAKKCKIVESDLYPIVKKAKKPRKKKAKCLPQKKHFDKWATSANETLIEAENFELVIE